MVSHGHGFHFDHRQGGIRLAAVARELRHRVAGVGVLILSHAHARQQFTFDDDLRSRDGFLFDRYALYQLNRLLAQRPGDAQLVVAKRRGRGLKARADVDGGVETHVDRHRQRFSGILRLFAEDFDMAPGGKEHGKLVVLLNAEAVDGDIRQRAVFRIACQHQPQTEERTRINRRVGRGRKQLAKVEVRIVSVEDLLLTGGLRGRDDNRRNRLFDCLADVLCQFRRLTAQQQRRALAAGVHAHQDAGVRIALHAVEHHRRARAGRTFDRAACANMAVDARQFRVGVDRTIGFNVLPFVALQ